MTGRAPSPPSAPMPKRISASRRSSRPNRHGGTGRLGTVLMGLVAIGVAAGAYFYFQGDDTATGGPPLILADTSPVRMAPGAPMAPEPANAVIARIDPTETWCSGRAGRRSRDAGRSGGERAAARCPHDASRCSGRPGGSGRRPPHRPQSRRHGAGRDDREQPRGRSRHRAGADPGNDACHDHGAGNARPGRHDATGDAGPGDRQSGAGRRDHRGDRTGRGGNGGGYARRDPAGGNRDRRRLVRPVVVADH